MFGTSLEDFEFYRPNSYINEVEVDPCEKVYLSKTLSRLSEKLTDITQEMYDDKRFEVMRCRAYHSKELWGATLLDSKDFKFRRGIYVDRVKIAVNPFGLLFARVTAHAPNMGLAKYYELSTADELGEGNIHDFIAEFFGKKNVKKLLKHIYENIKKVKEDDFIKYS